MTEFPDWTITLTFTVPAGDVHGTYSEALFDAAIDHAPTAAHGITARANTDEGKVWITFTLVETSEELAKDMAEEMRGRVGHAVLSSDDACISAS